MDTQPGNSFQLAHVSKLILKRILTIGENRSELLLLELQEERQRIMLAVMFMLGAIIFLLLGGFSFTLVVALLFWQHSPIIAMGVLTVVYLGFAVFLYARLVQLKREWQTLPETLDQLRKDIQCLENTLS